MAAWLWRVKAVHVISLHILLQSELRIRPTSPTLVLCEAVRLGQFIKVYLPFVTRTGLLDVFVPAPLDNP